MVGESVEVATELELADERQITILEIGIVEERVEVEITPEMIRGTNLLLRPPLQPPSSAKSECFGVIRKKEKKKQTFV